MSGLYSRDPQVVADTVAEFAGVLAEHYRAAVIHANGSSSFFIGTPKRGEGVLVGVNVSSFHVVVSVLVPGAELARFFYGEYRQVPDVATVAQFVDMVVGRVVASAENLAQLIAEHFGTTARVSESDPLVWFVQDLYGGKTDNLCTVFSSGGHLHIVANACANSSQNGFTLEVAVHFIDSAYGVGGAAGVIFEYVVPVSVCVRGGVVQWSNAEAGGSLACIADAVTGNEITGDDSDVLLDAFGNVTDSVLRGLISGA